MRKVLLLAMVVLCTASVAFAQGGAIGVFADPGATSCNLTDIGFAGALCNYYVVHFCVPGATGCQYQVLSGHLGIAFPDTPVFQVTIGSAAAGVSIGYGACMAGTIHNLTLSYFCQGLTPPCATMEVVGHPTATPPGLLAVSCNQEFVGAKPHTSLIDCPDDCTIPDCSTVPVENSTWGNIKSLYQGE